MSTDTTLLSAPGQDSTDTGAQATTDTATTTAAVDATTTTADTQATATTEEAAATKTADAPKAPEVYEFKAPEGVTLDEKATAEFSAVAKELDLPQDAAQKLVDLYASRMQAQAEAHRATVESWRASVETDKELGGDNLKESVAVAMKTIDTFGSPELKALLTQTGLGNHPELFKFAHRIGKSISQDRFVVGNETGAQQAGRSIANALYPNQA
jgi:hypothetical protein